jgi:hypothetical protein
MITLNNVQVLNHRGGTTGTDNARVFVFERVSHSVPANEIAPTQAQVSVINSNFDDV